MKRQVIKLLPCLLLLITFLTPKTYNISNITIEKRNLYNQNDENSMPSHYAERGRVYVDDIKRKTNEAYINIIFKSDFAVEREISHYAVSVHFKKEGSKEIYGSTYYREFYDGVINDKIVIPDQILDSSNGVFYVVFEDHFYDKKNGDWMKSDFQGDEKILYEMDENNRVKLEVVPINLRLRN